MLLPKIKKIPKNTNGRLAIPALAGLLVQALYMLSVKVIVGMCRDVVRRHMNGIPFRQMASPDTTHPDS